MRNAYEDLLHSGLPVDWTVIVLGWRNNCITRDQLIEHAMDRIGYEPPEIEGLLGELAYVDPRDVWKINRLAQELESSDPLDQRRAMRVWRWVLFRQVITMDQEETWLDAIEFWGDNHSWIEEPTELCNIAADTNERSGLEAYRAWLDREYADLAD